MGRRKKGDPVHGWINLDKPYDMTSSQAVNAVRRHLNAQKAGHAGTLDPLASGILPIALGEATKTVPYVQDSQKVYVFTVKWGEATSTDDTEGEVIATSDVRPEGEAIKQALKQFEGDIEQIPPQFSAVKVEGERAYDLARAGEAMELAARLVHVYKASLLDTPDPDHAIFEIVSGTGFYVRALARDIGKALGTEAHVTELRRAAVGPFLQQEAVSLEEFLAAGHDGAMEQFLLPVETALDGIPALALTAEEACHMKNGQAVALLRRQDRARLEEFRTRMEADPTADPDLADTAVAMFQGQPLAICLVDGVNLQPIRVLNL